MVITWYGQSCFKIQSGDLVMVIDPFSKDIGLTPPRFRADIALVTHAHADHNNLESITGDPFSITGPGEFEVKGAYIHGIETFHDTQNGKERGLNTIFLCEIEGIRVLHMGDYGEEVVRNSRFLEEVGKVDILLVPVGGTYTIDGENAARLSKDIEPRYVIPMHYKIPDLKISLQDNSAFLKEMGVKNAQQQEKFTIKKKDIAVEEKTEVIVLKPA
ncbi:MAG: MBL fold metallo-hydrolase [bacterium]|nr:MBL fold metallo-hydrolase [bacterium]